MSEENPNQFLYDFTYRLDKMYGIKPIFDEYTFEYIFSKEDELAMAIHDINYLDINTLFTGHLYDVDSNYYERHALMTLHDPVDVICYRWIDRTILRKVFNV